jgi:hypothetical protein
VGKDTRGSSPFPLNTLRNAIRQLGKDDSKKRGRTSEEDKKDEKMYDIRKFDSKMPSWEGKGIRR